MTEVIVRANQDIYDICLQEYGTLDLLGKLISDNSLNYNGSITQGQVLKLDSSVLTNRDVQDFFGLKNKHPQNNYIFKNDIPAFSWDNNNITFDTILRTFDAIKL